MRLLLHHHHGLSLLFLFLPLLQFLLRKKRKGIGRAYLHTGRHQPRLLPVDTGVTFPHLPVCSKGGNPIRTSHDAGVAADTVRGIIQGKARILVLLQAAAGTAHYTGGIETMHTADRIITQLPLPALQGEGIAEWLLPRRNIDIILIHTSQSTG